MRRRSQPLNRWMRIAALSLVALAVSSAGLSAQLRDTKAFTLEAAKVMADAAEAEALANGWNVVIAILDDAGDLVLLRRLDGAQRGSIEIALSKARTAARFRRDTKLLADAVAAGSMALLSTDLITLEGGIAVSFDGEPLGAIGVSGVRAFQDAQIAQAGADALRP